MNKIYPSMLSSNFLNLEQELSLLQSAGADAIHWDVMDGSFVDNITFGAHIIKQCRKVSDLRFDAHLMIQDPLKHIDAFIDAGVNALIVHQEACDHLHKTLYAIKNRGILCGIAINPATNHSAIEYCKDLVDLVLIMSVNPGSSGQKFIKSQFNKIAAVRREFNCEICVDGGIDDITIAQCAGLGADSFVTGSYLFKSSDYHRTIEHLKNI